MGSCPGLNPFAGAHSEWVRIPRRVPLRSLKARTLLC
jgi:hypothetical protein